MIAVERGFFLVWSDLSSKYALIKLDMYLDKESTQDNGVAV